MEHTPRPPKWRESESQSSGGVRHGSSQRGSSFLRSLYASGDEPEYNEGPSVAIHPLPSLSDDDKDEDRELLNK